VRDAPSSRGRALPAGGLCLRRHGRVTRRRADDLDADRRPEPV